MSSRKSTRQRRTNDGRVTQSSLAIDRVRVDRGYCLSDPAPPFAAAAQLAVACGASSGNGATIPMLAMMLSQNLGRPVIDKSGLTGSYDFQLTWTPDVQVTPADVTAGPSLFTAITDQLGLKLESKKGPVQVYVIEKVEQPTEN